MSNLCSPDKYEQQLPDFNSAQQMMLEKAPGYAHMLEKWCEWLYQLKGKESDAWLSSIYQALVISCSRMALRHGSWGNDGLQYHNENHIRVILDKRIPKLVDLDQAQLLCQEDWALLALFAACHDLRQRETGASENGVGPNERSSVAETHRILTAVGLPLNNNKTLFSALEYMISGSTFIIPSQLGTSPSQSVGGALAPSLIRDTLYPSTLNQEQKDRVARLSLVAADLDTANVADPFYYFAKSAKELCEEREYRCKRNINSEESRLAVIDFLGLRQREYFHQLHRFHSSLGATAFSSGKLKNESLLEVLTHKLEQYAKTKPEALAPELINYFMNTALELSRT